MDDDDVGNHRFVTVILIPVYIIREKIFRTICEKASLYTQVIKMLKRNDMITKKLFIPYDRARYVSIFIENLFTS